MTYRSIALAIVLLAAPYAEAQSAIAGTWKLTFQTDQGAVEADMILNQDGPKLTGTLASPQGEAPMEGTFTDNKLLLSLTVDAQGQVLTITFSGVLEKDTLKGDVDFGGFGAATWAATRK
jgi:hypothetical protein